MQNDLFIGVDPDLHRTGIAAIVKDVSGRPVLLRTGVAEVHRKHVGLDACARMARGVVLALNELFGDQWWPKCGDFPRIFLAVEGQQKYMGEGGKKSNPEDLIRLGHVTGAAAAWEPPMQYFGRMGRRIVIPSKWKGQVPKDICQARAFQRLGIPFVTQDAGYCVPTYNIGTTPVVLHNHLKSEWKHIGDAVALALWAFRDVHESPVRDALESEWCL